MGSPPCEWGRGRNSETESETTLTHAFYMQEKELTIGEWAATGELNVTLARAGAEQCTEPSCPVAQVNWYEALRFANRYSAWKGKPECYTLQGCGPDAGPGPFGCTNVSAVNTSVYDCDGYRLPTEAEWEYAVRAGTRSPTFAGPLTPIPPPADPTDCSTQPIIEPFAWYCANSGGRTHPVGQKSPNPWGLLDLLGNVLEHTSDMYTGIGHKPARRVDPGALIVPGDSTPLRGGSALLAPRNTRSAGHIGFTRLATDGGLRLVRTAK
ncbi:MAG: formylglycine-generating enzyme family protein [Myxococcales bacterium]|nr:formylglycine-generating enzyme family protein [Myxococcales bacterium]